MHTFLKQFFLNEKELYMKNLQDIEAKYRTEVVC